jgi:hypothetical protein
MSTRESISKQEAERYERLAQIKASALHITPEAQKFMDEIDRKRKR